MKVFKIIMGLLLMSAISSTSVFATEKLSVQQAGNYLVKRSNGTVVNSPGYTGTTQYFAQYNDAVSLAATTSRACGGCDIWVVQPSLKVDMLSDAPNVVTITATVTDKVLTVTWVAPTARIDGVALATSEIANYVVTVAPASGTPQLISTNNATLTATTTLASGSYQISIICVDTAGLASAQSTVVAVIVP